MSTLEKVKKVVVDQLSVDESLVTPEASLLLIWVQILWIRLNWLWLLKKNSDAKFLMKKLKKFKLFKTQLTTSILTSNLFVIAGRQ